MGSTLCFSSMVYYVTYSRNKPRVNSLPVAFPLDELQYSVGDLLVQPLEQIVTPRHQRQLVDLVDALERWRAY